MSSSVKHRNDKLRLLDDQFEKRSENCDKIRRYQLETIRQELGQVHLNEQGSELKDEMVNKATKTSKEYVKVESELFTKNRRFSINSDNLVKSQIKTDVKKFLKNEESDLERQVEVAEESR
ncbi:6931_t:CDS:2 [Racocetra persica]|uniref:6931_t:CDS:1 n=1 Tax=Racocetra persica TaxID=160502 RepID=A0ACA9QSA3_9GLOM|nr:6931_t:CDS:2 [Racocetra persica]